MILKNLIHRELSEGIAETELADTVHVPRETVANILAGKLPHDRSIWENFARYFRMEVDFLRTGDPTCTSTPVGRRGSDHPSVVGYMRMVPFLTRRRLEEMAAREELPKTIDGDAMIETTDIEGTRTFAVKVPDDSMAPLFDEEELIFVNPDLKWEPGDYVLVRHPDGRPETLLRQIKRMDNHIWLYPLNRTYQDLLLNDTDKVVGKIVRQRKNF